MTTAYERNKLWRKKHPEKSNNHRRKNGDKRKEYRERNYDQTEKNNTNKGQPWLSEDVLKIMDPQRPTDRELSKLLGRSVKRIHKKRAREIAKQTR